MGAAVVAGKAFVKDSGKIFLRNALSVILYGQADAVRPFFSVDPDFWFCVPAIFHRVQDQLVQDESNPFYIRIYGIFAVYFSLYPTLDQVIFVFAQYILCGLLQRGFFDQIVFVHFIGAGVEESHVHVVFRFLIFMENPAEDFGQGGLYVNLRGIVRLISERKIRGSFFEGVLIPALLAQEGYVRNGSLDLMNPAFDILPIFLSGVFHGPYALDNGFIGLPDHVPVQCILQAERLGHKLSQEIFVIGMGQNFGRFVKILYFPADSDPAG